MILATTALVSATGRVRQAVLPVVLAIGLGIVMATPAAAQDGTLRGTITDNTGAALPGATVTASGPALIGTNEAVTDDTGQYRLGNLPPGTYVVTAQLQGFAVARRENIDVRAGANFQVDLALALGSLEETILVTGESPMIETQLPTNVLNVDGDFQRSLPLLEGKNVTDVMEVTPGVFGRVATTAPRTLYFAAAADQNDNVAELEGFYAATVNDTTINRISLTPEAVEDTQLKTGGQPASSPMAKGIIMSVTLKNGGNQFAGSVGYTYQPFGWNDSNIPAGTGAPAQRQVRQTDYSLGGPILKDRVWFFTAGRYQDNAINNGRTDIQAANLAALFPGQEAEESLVTGFQPVGKVTGRFGKHTLLALAQYRRRRRVQCGGGNARAYYRLIDRWLALRGQAHVGLERQPDDVLQCWLQQQGRQHHWQLRRTVSRRAAVPVFPVDPVVEWAPRRRWNPGVERRHAGDQRLHLLPAGRSRHDAHVPR